jgi:para-nitrobenzyl esterase
MRQGFGLLILSFLAWVGAACAQPPQARTTSGEVAGIDVGGGVVAFKGIPYAAAPVGQMRWKPPGPAPSWTGMREATQFGAICPQPARPDGAAAMGAGGAQSEDCLFLNVWAPKAAHRAPVMVWIHGGAFRFGAGSGPFYDGATFARDGVVLVSINYRLGALGWFAHPALTKEAAPDAPLGNYGLMDQIAALQWVKANIAAFGGDPGNVTIFGESAGGSSILALMATPSAKGLFAKAIVESGGGWSRGGSLAQAEQAGARLASTAGLDGANATAEQLRALPPEKLFAIPRQLAAVGPFPDGRLMLEQPSAAFLSGRAAAVPLIIGSNSYEASLMNAFAIPPAGLVAILRPQQKAAYASLGSDEAIARAAFTDAVMGGPARWVAGQASAHAPAYLYQFSYVPTARRATAPGAAHGGEIPYVFDSASTLLRAYASPQDAAMSNLVHSCWVSFAKTGAPACSGAPAWPTYRPDDDRLMEFGADTGVRQHWRKAYLDADQAALGY